jgi:hypothetical protein
VKEQGSWKGEVGREMMEAGKVDNEVKKIKGLRVKKLNN